MRAQRSTLLDSDRQLWHYLSMFASLEVPKNHLCLLKPYFIAWSLSNWICLKEKTRCPHEGTLLGLGRSVRTALKRNYTHGAPWILSLWNPIPSVACFWQTESILRMGQGSFKGIPASKIESHFQRQTGTFFPCHTETLWQLGTEVVSMTGMGYEKVFFQKTKYVLQGTDF